MPSWKDKIPSAEDQKKNLLNSVAEEQSKESEESEELREDTEENRIAYKNETGGRPILKGQPTKGYGAWLSKPLSDKVETKEDEKSTPKKEKKKRVSTWKDEVSKQKDPNLKFVDDLRKDLKDYILELRSEKIEIENQLLKIGDTGFVAIVYGRPGIGKSIFCASGVLDDYSTIFLDLSNQGRRLKQFPLISKSKHLKYESFDEKKDGGEHDSSKVFEKLYAFILHVIGTYDTSTILIIDGFSQAITDLNSYLRNDILDIGPAKKGRQEDVGFGNWYWRKMRYSQLLKAIEDGADKGFRIFLTCQVKDVVEVSTINEKLRISKTGERAPNVRDEDLYAADIEIFFRNAYDLKTKQIGERQIEIMVSKVPGINEGIVLSQPKMKDFLDLVNFKNPKKLVFK